MKSFLSLIAVLASSLMLSGCGVLCQAGTGTCGMSKEQAAKLLHGKAYGEFFVKPGVTKDAWRQDWVACGGRQNGQYSNDAPPRSTSAVSIASTEKKVGELTNCMQSKGYSFKRD